MGFFDKIKKFFGFGKSDAVDKESSAVKDTSVINEPPVVIAEIDVNNSRNVEAAADNGISENKTVDVDIDCLSKSSTKPEVVGEERNKIVNSGIDNNEFYREMLAICKPIPAEDFDFNIFDNDDGTKCCYIRRYNGTEDSIIIPETINGAPVENVRWFDLDKKIKNIIFPKTVEEVSVFCFSNSENVCFAPGSNLRKIDALKSELASIYRNDYIKKINLPLGVDCENFLTHYGFEPEFYSCFPTTKDGVSMYGNRIIGAKQTVDVLYTGKAKSLYLTWPSRSNRCGKVVIESALEELVLPKKVDMLAHIDSFEVVNNEKFIVEDDILYEILEDGGRKLLFVNKTRKSEVLTIGYDIKDSHPIVSEYIKTVIVLPKFLFCPDFFDGKTIDNIVIKHKDTKMQGKHISSIGYGRIIRLYTDNAMAGVSKVERLVKVPLFLYDGIGREELAKEEPKKKSSPKKKAATSPEAPTPKPVIAKKTADEPIESDKKSISDLAQEGLDIVARMAASMAEWEELAEDDETENVAEEITEDKVQESVQQTQISEAVEVGAEVETNDIPTTEIVDPENSIEENDADVSDKGITTNLQEKYSADVIVRVRKILDKLEELYPEHKIFALSALMDDAREGIAKIAKSCGLSNYEELLHDFGYEIISKEEVRALRSKVIYTPGNEPKCIKNKVDNLLKLLEEYYPDKIIETAIDKEHKSAGGKITGLYQWLGYRSPRDFIIAYGYDYRVKEVGRLDEYLDEVMEFLKSKYSGDHKAKSLTYIYEENSDIEGKIKNIAVNSKKLFGMDLSDYFVSIGILRDYAAERNDALESLLAFLNEQYPSGTTMSVAKLEKSHPQLSEWRDNAEFECKNKHGRTLSQYLVDVGIIKPKSEPENIVDFTLNKSQTHIVKYLGSDTHIVIPAKISAIDDDAFANSSVIEVSLEPGSALKNIGKSAFKNCHSLVLLDFSNSTSTEIKIDEGAFKNCEKLEEIRGEWESVQIRARAFKGCVNIFIRDGEYIYPRLWLYKILLGGEKCRAMSLEPSKIVGSRLPYVKVFNSHINRAFELDMQVVCNSVPVAADAGYGNVVMLAGKLQTRQNYLDDIGMSKNVALKYAFYCKVLYMPTEKTVSYFLEKMVVDSHPHNINVSTEEYISLQRAFFERFNNCYSSIREQFSNIHRMERVDFSFENEITKPAESEVYVTFIGHKGYSYRCAIDAREGDVVCVSGSRSGEIGVVVSVDSGLPEGDFYKDVVKVYRQPVKRDPNVCSGAAIYDPTRTCCQFWGIVDHTTFNKIYKNLPIISNNNRTVGVSGANTTSSNDIGTKADKHIQLYEGKKCLIRVVFSDSTELLCNCIPTVQKNEYVSVCGTDENEWAKVVEIVGLMDETKPFVRGITS